MANGDRFDDDNAMSMSFELLKVKLFLKLKIANNCSQISTDPVVR